MANMLSHNKNAKPVKKTMEDHAEDALYREINEEVHAEKLYGFVKKNMRALIAGAILILIVVISVQLRWHYQRRAAMDQARLFEFAVELSASGKIDSADKMFEKAAKRASSGMGDLAMWESAMMDLRNGKGIDKLERIATNADSRDFRDLALIRLAGLRNSEMTGTEFEKYLRPVLTDNSPFYYTGMLLVAQKYLASDDINNANKWLDKIIGNKNSPAIISSIAESLR